MDTELELFDELDDDRVIFRQTVEVRHDAPRLSFFPSTEEVTPSVKLM